MDTPVFWWGLLFSSIGMVFFMYGKRQRSAVPMGCGLILMIYPYFVSSSWVMAIIGGALCTIPYFLRLY